MKRSETKPLLSKPRRVDFFLQYDRAALGGRLTDECVLRSTALRSVVLSLRRSRVNHRVLRTSASAASMTQQSGLITDAVAASVYFPPKSNLVVVGQAKDRRYQCADPCRCGALRQHYSAPALHMSFALMMVAAQPIQATHDLHSRYLAACGSWTMPCPSSSQVLLARGELDT
jgi:hypothetical protein